MMFRNVPPVSSDMAGNEKCPNKNPGILRKEDHRSKWRIFQRTMELITRGVAWWVTFSSFQFAGLRIATIVFCDNYVYIYILVGLVGGTIATPPPRPTFCVLGMSLPTLSFFSSSHLSQHCIRKVAYAHAPGHISPTYVAVA